MSATSKASVPTITSDIIRAFPSPPQDLDPAPQPPHGATQSFLEITVSSKTTNKLALYSTLKRKAETCIHTYANATSPPIHDSHIAKRTRYTDDKNIPTSVKKVLRKLGVGRIRELKKFNSRLTQELLREREKNDFLLGLVCELYVAVVEYLPQ
ncbi:hypothetical protein NEOLI_004986 [Neolecta irregularis DAH-3]|uniref:Uncharacterized protein n=1 Tax=Neolecta irregularis (strain DAH-3) TaxID=1198029 RepID=A0A1U7LW69_NEOID|nr:hypothetical protein NEOLI_004986 [Neolecta irregularis DAH-3]|eukprot:OLL26925.1 hypothetical protein NEOLI_004986 [Neolecta irregularis DAH-3]